MEKSVGVGDILKATIDIVSSSARDIGIFALILGGLTAVGVIMGLTETASTTFSMGFAVDATDSVGSSLFDLLAAVVSVVAGYMLVKALLAGQGLLHTEGNRFWLYLGMMILSIIGFVIGFLLLIVPGIILMVRWSASTGFLLGKGEGITESLSASWHATKGHGLAIFFAGLLMIIGIFILVGILAAVAFVLGSTAGGVLTAFLEAAANGVGLAFGVAVYQLVADDTAKVGEVFS